jgi:hypothetical protein
MPENEAVRAVARIASLVFVCPGALLVLANYWLTFRYYWYGRRASLAPVLGGLLLCFGLLIHPNWAVRAAAWAGLLIDPSILDLLTFAWRNRKRGERE